MDSIIDFLRVLELCTSYASQLYEKFRNIFDNMRYS